MDKTFNFNQHFGAIVLIAASQTVIHVIETLKLHHFSGHIILIEDEDRPLTQIPDTLIDRRFTIHPNQIDTLIPYVTSLENPLACVVGWYKIFNKNFIQAFQKNILNMHTGDLPNYRGAGGGSWQVLNGERRIQAHIQQMVLAVDRGAVLFSEAENLPEKPYPRDVKAAGAVATKRVLNKLGLAIVHKEIVNIHIQDEQNATYFPLLKTDIHGWLDFSWNYEQLDRFIRAFSYPYPGASFIYLGNTYRVKECSARQSNIEFHPFCYGLITNIDNDSLHVVCQGGIICLSELADINNTPVAVKTFKIGKSLITQKGSPL